MSAEAKKRLDEIFSAARQKLVEAGFIAKENEDFCGCEDDGYTCTRPKGHLGKHVSCGYFDIVHEWDQ